MKINLPETKKEITFADPKGIKFIDRLSEKK
jgi:hypothetical protein